MGTSLCPVANCRPLFAGKPFYEAVALIQQTLNGLVLENPGSPAARSGAPPADAERPWQPEWENVALYNWGKKEAGYDCIWFGGPYGLSLSFGADYIEFFNPAYRYRQWLGLQNADGTPATQVRDGWRRYFRQLARTFGGDRVIYLADNTHPLDKYRDVADSESFAAMERQLHHDLGPSSTTFAEVLADECHRYFVDYFFDLDNCPHNLE